MVWLATLVMKSVALLPLSLDNAAVATVVVGVASKPAKPSSAPAAPSDALSMAPLRASKTQSPPRAVAPVGLSEAATSARVICARRSINCPPSAPLAIRQPYSKISPCSPSASPQAANCVW